MSLLNAEYDRLSATDRKSTIGTNLQKQIQALNTEISSAEQATGRYQRNVGNYASSWNGLSVSVQQVARELPSLAVGWNTFFLAISNNLPMLADELKKAAAEYKAFKMAVAAGNNDVAKVAPVWKQLITSIFSWQTALVAAITLLSVYGKDIIEWTKSLLRGGKALSYLTDQQKRLNEAQKESIDGIFKESTQLKILYTIATDSARSYEARVKAAKKMQELYPEYLGYLSDFLVKVYVGTKSPIGTEQTFSFGVKPEDLFRVSYKDIGGGNSKVDGVKECLVVPLDLPLFEWNIENFSCVIKISIEEIDGTETQRTLSQTTAEFAGNFELNPVKGVFEKVGLKFGASAKKTITTTFEKTFTLGNDELGDVIVNFYDPVVLSGDWIEYAGRRDMAYSIPLNSKYYNGYYKIELAPLKMY